MNKHIILDFQTGEKVTSEKQGLPQNDCFAYLDSLTSKSLKKANCDLLINRINEKHGLRLHISIFKPFIGKTDKRVFADKDYLFCSKTWKGVLSQLQAFAIGLDLKVKK